MTFEILLYLNMFYTMFYAGIETFFFFMKYLYVPDFGNFLHNKILRSSVRSSRSHNVRSVQACLELSIFFIMALGLS